MEITVQKNDLELILEAKCSNSYLEEKIQTLAKKLSKTVKLPGFQVGKVPIKAVVKFYKEKLTQDAEKAIIQGVLSNGLKKEEIDSTNILGEILILNKDEIEDGFFIKLKAYLRPIIEIDDSLIEKLPEIKKEKVSDDEVEERIKLLIEDYQRSNFNKEEPLKLGDTAVVDFEGFINGQPFEGGKGKDYVLELGSGKFIPSFEEQLIGLRIGDEASIKVTFPEDYKNESLRGKEAIFECEIQNIMPKIENIELNDEIARNLLEKEEDIDPSLTPVDNLRKMIRQQLEEEKLNDQITNNDIHEKVKSILLETIQFEVPKNIVDKEMELWINNKVKNMSDEEVKKLQEDEEEFSKLFNKLIDSVVDSVRLTFIIDELAKREKILITDKQILDFINYQTLLTGENPIEIIKKFKDDNNSILLLKMKMIEFEVITNLLKKRIK